MYKLPALSSVGCCDSLLALQLAKREAAANNMAIIANDIPVFKEIYSDDEVLYFKQNDPEDLAEKMSRLIKNQHLISIFKKRVSSKIKKYTWTKIIKSYINLYTTIIKS